MLDEHLAGPYRIVEAEDPWRDRFQDEFAGYAEAVHDWRRRRADVCEKLIREELAPGQFGAFLVWGDPSLYGQVRAEARAEHGWIMDTYLLRLRPDGTDS